MDFTLLPTTRDPMRLPLRKRSPFSVFLEYPSVWRIVDGYNE
jgi:hypothetical protein